MSSELGLEKVSDFDLENVSDFSLEEERPRTLPGMLTSSGPIWVGYSTAAVIPAALGFMVVRELAWKSIDPEYPARTEIAAQLNGDEAAAKSAEWAAELVGNLVVLGPSGQLRFLAELFRYIEFHKDATGLEGLLITALESTWRYLSVDMAAHSVKVWKRYARNTKFAATRETFAYHEATRTLRIFKPGDIGQLSPETALLDRVVAVTAALSALAADPRLDPPYAVGRGIPGGDLPGGDTDFRDRNKGDWSNLPGSRNDLNGLLDSLGEERPDFQSPDGWRGTSRPGRGGWTGTSGRRPGSEGFDDSGSSGTDYRNGQPSPGERPGGRSRGPGMDIGFGRRGGNRFGSGTSSLLDQLGLGQGAGRSRAFVNGPFSEAFIGRPGPGGPEARDAFDDEARGQSLKDDVPIYLAAAAILGAVSLASKNPVAIFATGVALAGAHDSNVHGNMIIAGAKREQAKAQEKKEADKKDAEKKDAEKKDAEKKREDERKAAEKKAEEDTAKRKKAEEEAAKKKSAPPPPKKKKGESGLYPDPYGDGGGNPATGRLSEIPVDDSGSGGVGPNRLSALPAEDDDVVGPNASYLPDDDGDGGQPDTVFSFSALTLAGPGLNSMVVRTSSDTALLLGMPKLSDGNQLVDAGLLGALALPDEFRDRPD